jgi:membrane-associated phospholipid phosphatase
MPAGSDGYGATVRTASVQLWGRRRDPVLRLDLALVALFVAAVVAFADIAEDYLTRDPLVRWDVSFAAWLHEHSTPALVTLAKIVTWGGNFVFLGSLTVIVAVLLFRTRLVSDAVLLCVVAIGIEVLNGLLKLAFHRPRPELAYLHLDTYSFPSGHAAGSAAVYGALAFLLGRHVGRGGRIGCACAFVVVVCAIGFTRLYLGVHYLSDVLAGFSIGVAWLAACLFLYRRYLSRRRVTRQA